MALDRRLLVLSIVREADNALTYRMIFNRSNLRANDLEETMGLLSLKGQIRTFAGDEEKPLHERRFFSTQDTRRAIEEYIEGQLPELAGEGYLFFTYGAELDPDYYCGLSPGARFLMRGCLEGYRLIFSSQFEVKGGLANPGWSSGSEVRGAACCLDEKYLRLPSSMPALDLRKGY